MEEGFCWIHTLERDEAPSELREAYAEVCRGDGSVHNMYKAFASRPDLLVLADRFYRELLHNPRRTLPDWQQELIATYVALLSGCRYAADNHGANFRRLLGDEIKGRSVLETLGDGALPTDVDEPLLAMLRYTRKLTLTPALMEREDVEALRAAGLDDAQIFEVNQIAANFAYWSRMLNGLGVRAAGEPIGA